MNTDIRSITQWLGTGSLNIFGMPFAGKDTQGKRLADYFGGILISSGDILRHDHGNSEVQRIMAEGGNIPSELFGQIVLPFLQRDELKDKPLILSEVGRLIGEDDAVMQATEASGHPTRAVVFLKLDEATVWQRFRDSQTKGDRGKRADDSDDVLQARLDHYREGIMPVIERYREKGLLIEIDGTKPVDEVTNDILSALEEKATTKKDA